MVSPFEKGGLRGILHIEISPPDSFITEGEEEINLFSV
jgi:hypothetical protein